MQVRHGWSGEIRPNLWTKLSIDLDEGDLRRILHTADLHPDPDRVPLPVAYQLLDTEAERLLIAKLLSRAMVAADEGHARLTEATTRRDKVLAGLRTLLEAG